MHPDRGDLQPLRHQESPAGAELAAWDLLQTVDTEVGLSELSAARVLARIDAAVRQPARRHPRWLMAAAAVAFSLLGIQIAAAAVIAAVPTLRQALSTAVGRRLTQGARAGMARPVPPSAPQPRQLIARPATPAPRLAPAPVPAIAQAPRPAARPTARSGKSPPAVALETSSRPEVEVMTQAARQLYADHDAVAALATLEPYLYLHPAGSLRPEMIREAVQADLELDRTPEALGLLDGLAAQDFAGIPRASELRLLRGELLARNHRCSEAVSMFEQSLAASNPAERERALYGRAACRAELGDLAGSRADLGTYLQQFPGGRFAGEAQRALERGR
jgi:hypothetical protein